MAETKFAITKLCEAERNDGKLNDSILQFYHKMYCYIGSNDCVLATSGKLNTKKDDGNGQLKTGTKTTFML